MLMGMIGDKAPSVAAAWTPASLAVAPRVWIYSPDAVYSGSNLTSITSRGSNGTAMTVTGPPVKGTVSNGITPIASTTGKFLSQTIPSFGTGGKLTIFAFGLVSLATNGLVNYNWISSAGSGPCAVLYGAISGFGSLFLANRTAGTDAAPAYSVDPNQLFTGSSLHSVYAQAGSTNAAWTDGTTVTIGTGVTQQTGSAPNYSSAIAWEFMCGSGGGTHGDENFNGDLFTLLLLDYFATTGERQQLEGWAWWTFTGGASGLPGGHPYKSSPP